MFYTFIFKVEGIYYFGKFVKLFFGILVMTGDKVCTEF